MIGSITEALSIIKNSEQVNETVELLSSYEPLHFQTFLKAHLCNLSGGKLFCVNTYGYDQLNRGMKQTSGSSSSAVLLLDWADLHPSLSWRTRAEFSSVGEKELESESIQFVNSVVEWVRSRVGVKTVLVLPAIDWLPLMDSSSPDMPGKTSLLARRAICDLAIRVVAEGAYIVEALGEIDFRSLLNAGSPLSAQNADDTSGKCARLLYRVPRKKVVIVDLDNTLWHGVLGEDGVDGIQCEESVRGRPYLVFQKFLSKLKREGILVAYASKNDPKDIDSVLSSPNTWLNQLDFAAGIGGWNPKTEMIQAICEELSIGLDSAIFIDDSPVERALVNQELPQVLCLAPPTDGRKWKRFYDDLQLAVWTGSISQEDLIRSAPFEQHRRSTYEGMSGSSNYSHLMGMELKLTSHENAFSDARCLELINKTNQFNLNGIRVSDASWKEKAAQEGSFCYSFELSDRFGPYGTIAVCTGEVNGPDIQIHNFVVSCRALGRGVEAMILDYIVDRLKISKILCNYSQTGRNEPIRVFLEGVSTDFNSKVDRVGVHDSFTLEVEIPKLRALAELIHHEGGVTLVDSD
jgi:FkbH-like protein